MVRTQYPSDRKKIFVYLTDDLLSLVNKRMRSGQTRSEFVREVLNEGFAAIERRRKRRHG